MKLSTFLAINGIGYIVLGIWCAAAPYYTSNVVGLALPSSKGLAEYVAVYGGLEFGLGLFFLFGAIRNSLRKAALLFSLCLYSGLVVFRIGAMVIYNSPTTDIGWVLFGLETTFLFLSIYYGRKFLLHGRD